MEGTPCVFPFYDSDEEYYVCKMYEGTPWCSIGNNSIGINQWGLCNSDCPGKLLLDVKCSYNHAHLYQLKFVRPWMETLVSFRSPTMVHSMIHVSFATMMTHHGVILVMV